MEELFILICRAHLPQNLQNPKTFLIITLKQTIIKRIQNLKYRGLLHLLFPLVLTQVNNLVVDCGFDFGQCWKFYLTELLLGFEEELVVF